MSRFVTTTLASLALLAAFGAPGLASASEATGLSSPEVALQTADAAAQTMDVQELADMSGGADTHIDANVAISHQELNGTATGNTVQATNFTTGAVNFDAGAFDNFNGIGNIVINTGANNVLQGSINVTIATTTAP